MNLIKEREDLATDVGTYGDKTGGSRFKGFPKCPHCGDYLDRTGELDLLMCIDCVQAKTRGEKLESAEAAWAYLKKEHGITPVGTTFTVAPAKSGRFAKTKKS
jgi:hypothetical protein